jgi:hypothetical protein
VLGPETSLQSPRGFRQQQFSSWLRERIFDPRPQEELRVLGFKGANELTQTRGRIHNQIFNMNATRLQQGQKPTSAATEGPIDPSFLTPEMQQLAKEAGHHSTLDPNTLANLLGVDTKHTGGLANHPLGAIQQHQKEQAQLAALYQQAKDQGASDTQAMEEMRKQAAAAGISAESIGILPWGTEVGGLGAASAARRARLGADAELGFTRDGRATLTTRHPNGSTSTLFFRNEQMARQHLQDMQDRLLYLDANHPLYDHSFTAPKLERHPTTPRIKGGAPQRLTREGRWQRYGNLTAWKPRSPSMPTAYAQDVMDRFQERLASKVDELRLSGSKTKRAAGKALTPFSARRTVPINRAKRVQRMDPRRARGRVAEEKRILRAPGHFMGVPMHEGEQLAHAVWIQLPKAYRNVEGLKLWQGQLKRELADVSDTSGTGLAARVDSYIENAKQKMKVAGQENDITALRQAQAEIVELQQIKADIPYRIQDLNEQIGKFDQVISKPPEYDPRVADAAETLNQEAEAIISRNFPDEAATFGPRTEKVSRWLGLEPTGEELYLHHGLPKGGRQTMTAGTGVGRITKPAGVGQRLGMTLARTGRVRLSLEPVIEHWQQAQSYDLASTMRDDLAKMGTPITERPGMRPAKTDIIINPEGRPKPRAWQRDPEMQATEENFNPEDHHIQKLDDFTRSFMAEGKDREALIQEAIAAGQFDQLRVVPEDVFYRYVGQYKDANAATPPQLRKVGKGVDAVNTLIYTSLIYANPGYIPANLVANFIMHFAQAGLFVPSDFARTIQILQARGARMQRLRDQLRSEIGHGPTVEAGSDIAIAQKLTRGVAMIPDDPVRMSALLHEAGRLGVIPKLLPRLREKDIQALEELLNNPNMKSRLNDVQDRAVQAMVDFERLGPLERAYAKRIMFVWSWMRGATRYPVRFALDHPGRSAVMAYIFAGAPGAPQSVRDKLHQFMPTVQHGMPPWLEGALRVGGTDKEPLILPTRSISPISTPFDLAQTIRSAPGAQTFGELLNPAIPAAWHIANRESPYGRQLPTYGDALLQAEERMAPTPNLIQDLISPSPDTGMYPDDKTRLGRLARASRVVPYHVDMAEAQKARVREGMTSSIEANVAQFKDDYKKYFHHDAPGYVVHQANLKYELDHRIRNEAEDNDRHIDYFKALDIVDEYLQKEKGMSIDKSNYQTQAAAHGGYLAYRKLLYPAFSAYDTRIANLDEIHRGEATRGSR